MDSEKGALAMQYRMLGPVGVWDAEHRVELGKAESAKARCVLAALLRDPGELITSETLAERVWGDDPPGPAVRYKYVGWIRAALAPYGVQLIFRDNGYVLQIDPDQVDLHRFRRLVGHGRNALGAGDHEEAAAVLRDALGLWHGPALAGLSGRWAELFRDQLTEERVSATVLRVRADLELGRHSEVIPELAELDTEPGPELRDLRRRIQAGDPGLLPGGVIIGGPDAPAGDEPAGEQRLRRVVIADDSAVLRDGMAWLLTARGHHVVAAVADADALMAAVEQHKPDIAIVDVRLAPAHAGEEGHAAVAMAKEHPGLGVLVFSRYIDTVFAAELLADRAGGVGYLLKDRVADVGEFIGALARVAEGGTVLDPELVARLLTTNRRGRELATLTDGERQVLALLAEGLPDSAIAQKLAVPPGEVGKHVSSLFHKLSLPPVIDRDRRNMAVLGY